MNKIYYLKKIKKVYDKKSECLEKIKKCMKKTFHGEVKKKFYRRKKGHYSHKYLSGDIPDTNGAHE